MLGGIVQVRGDDHAGRDGVDAVERADRDTGAGDPGAEVDDGSVAAFGQSLEPLEAALDGVLAALRASAI
jgi:hypothetical protein